MNKPENLVIVIFGASGDLTYRKLVPALYALYEQKLMPEKFKILGLSRSSVTTEEFRLKMDEGIKKFRGNVTKNKHRINEFLNSIDYRPIDLYSADEYRKLREEFYKINEYHNFIFYLSLPPVMFSIIAANLGKSGFNDQSDGFKRLVIEKPFGNDLGSGIQLNKELHEFFSEGQIYRIDHYLGKETVQNLLVMRFANGIFEPLWNRNYIHHVEITSAEKIGIEGRGGYYENAGALRDMLQNHLLQITGLVAMEPPSSVNADSIRNETMKVFQSLKPLKEDDVAKQVIFGQYTSSRIHGILVPGYREELNVHPESRTETYVAMKFYIDNWRWGGVPFYIRTGKRLPTNVTEIVVNFKPTPHVLFQQDSIYARCNQLIIRIQPDEGILIKFAVKQPGQGFTAKTVNMDFHYSDLIQTNLPLAYERLLHDVMMGDSTLYARADAVEAAWKFIAPVQNVIANKYKFKLYGYPAGTWGPENADNLIEDAAEGWRYPCRNLSGDGEYCEL